MTNVTELLAQHADTVRLLSQEDFIDLRKYLYLQPIRVALRYQDSIIDDIEQALPTPEWDWRWDIANALKAYPLCRPLEYRARFVLLHDVLNKEVV